MNKTPLYDIHIASGAKMTVFAGWEMPLEYSGMKDEHLTVRNAAGLFDISHLGLIEVSGPNVLDLLQRVSTNDAAILADGQVQYSLICNTSGGILDDVTVYKFNENRYILCVNASNTDKVSAWFKEQVGGPAEIRVLDFAALALQGPLSQQLLQGICDAELSKIRYYHFVVARIGGVEAVVSRTGYTGEDGFEIYIPSSAVVDVWSRVMETGKDSGIKPCGLGVRDSLRLEMGYTLYGNDILEDTTPLEAGLERFVRFDKGEFIGKDALLRQRQEGVKKRLVGFEMVERGMPRSHYLIHAEGRQVGQVTSGGQSPSLGKFIGMGYVEPRFSQAGNLIQIDIRGRMTGAVVANRPFYRRNK